MPGLRWRLLAHYVTSDGTYGDAINLRADDFKSGRSQFDELVVDRWLHVEQMDAHWWWMDVGGVQINVRVGNDGNATRVSVHDVDQADGCRYEGLVE